MVAHATPATRPASTHFLRSRSGWLLSYRVLPNGMVRLERTYRGYQSGNDILMDVETARKHYASQHRAGMVASLNTI